MSNRTEQRELKLLLEEAYELVDQMGREEPESPEERANRLLERAATWVSEAGFVPSGDFVGVGDLVEALREELAAQASSADNLDEFDDVWLRCEITERINSDEWEQRWNDAMKEMLKGIARRMLKNARRRRRRREKTARQL